jgi:hypothetical protein
MEHCSVRMLNEGPPPATPEIAHLVATHVHELVALAIGASHDAAAIAEAGNERRERRAQRAEARVPHGAGAAG